MLSLMLTCSLSAAQETETRIAVLISESIRPYVEAAEGFSQGVSGEVVEITMRRAGTEPPPELLEAQWDLIVGIGPHATHALPSIPGDTPRLFAMVLNAGEILPHGSHIPGVTLNIPPGFQMGVIARTLPTARHVGIFYDPRFSAELVASLHTAGLEHGLIVVPLPVASEKEIKDSLEEGLSKMDTLLMIPDRTVISEPVIEFLIKRTLEARVPVVGYNRFFQLKGALVSFIIDYRGVGRKAAAMAERLLDGERASWEPPPVEVEVNRKLSKKFGFVLTPETPSGEGGGS